MHNRAATTKAPDVKSPKGQTQEKDGSDIEIAGVRLSSPDRVLWPQQGATKAQLAEYLVEMADHILPHLKDRPVSLVRCPQGRQGKCFFQKHHNASTPDELASIDIKEKDGELAPYLLIQSVKGLVAAAQIGALELHVWGARIDMLERPERIVFDLDPDEGLDFVAVRSAAFEVWDVLQSLGLESFALLTGGKGIHVVAPVMRRNSWDEVKAFSQSLARKLEAAAPDRYVAQASKAKRTNRIFIDWLRNERGATAILPFSTRARAGCPVATPVSWEELESIDRASAYSIETMPKRMKALKSDPWKGYAEVRQSLTNTIMEAVKE